MSEEESSTQDGKTQRRQRIEFAWEDIERIVTAELKSGAEGLKIFILPFSTSAAEPQEIAGTEENIRRALSAARMRFPPDGATDIEGAVNKTTELIREGKRLDLQPNARLRIMMYSDGEQTIPAGESPAQLSRRVMNALEALNKEFISQRQFKNLTASMQARYWGKDPFPANAPIQRTSGWGYCNLEPLDDFTVVKSQGNAPVEIRGTLKVSGQGLAGIQVEITYDPPLLPAQLVKLNGTANAQQFAYSAKIPIEKRGQTTRITLRARLLDDVDHLMWRHTEMQSRELEIGDLPSVEIAYPQNGQYTETFTGLMRDLPVEAPLKLRWNAEAAHIPLRFESNELRVALSIKKEAAVVPADKPFTLAELFGEAQSGTLTVQLTAKEKLAQDVQLFKIVPVTAGVLKEVLIRARVEVTPPILEIQSIDVLEKELAAEQLKQDFEIKALLLSAGHGAAGRQVRIQAIVKDSDKFEAVVVLDGKSAADVFALKGEHLVSVILKPKSPHTLSAYKAGDVTLKVSAPDPALNIKGNTTVALNVTFKEKIQFAVQGFDADGRSLSVIDAISLRKGRYQQLTLKLAWNGPAVGKVVSHPLTAMLMLGEMASLSAQPPITDLQLDDTRARQITLRLAGMQDGASNPRELEFNLAGAPADLSRAVVKVPRIDIYTPVLELVDLSQSKNARRFSNSALQLAYQVKDVSRLKNGAAISPPPAWDDDESESGVATLQTDDPEIIAEFSMQNRASTSLKELKPGKTVSVALIYKGQQNIFSEQRKTPRLSITLKDAHGVAPYIDIAIGSPAALIVPPLIASSTAKIGALLLCIFAVIIAGRSANSKPAPIAATAVDAAVSLAQPLDTLSAPPPMPEALPNSPPAPAQSSEFGDL